MAKMTLNLDNLYFARTLKDVTHLFKAVTYDLVDSNSIPGAGKIVCT